MSYTLLKQAHMVLAVLSISGFVLRWSWRSLQSHLAARTATRVVPHVVDTLFLATALLMIFQLGQVPVSIPWLIAKISGLVLYIVLGTVAMHTAPNLKRSLPAFAGAMLTFAWIVSVALTKSPLGFL